MVITDADQQLLQKGSQSERAEYGIIKSCKVILYECSLRAPRLRPQGAADPEPYAREAKEFVRATCIGADCTVALEYTRKVPPPMDGNAAARATEVVMQFGNIEVPTKRGPQQLAEMVVRRGFAALQVCTLLWTFC